MNKNKNTVVGILTADWHLSHKPPIWRSNEPNWYDAMARPLDEIEELSKDYDCPVLCAGDVFDKWNSPAELINFAMRHLPTGIFAVPGQHDIPNHNIKEIARSAFTSLTLSERISNLDYEKEMFECGMGMFEQIVDSNILLWGFPFGTEFFANNYKSEYLKVALVHDYVWMAGHSYPKAPKEKKITRNNTHNKIYNGRYYGYDVIVYGDNHKSFSTHIGETTIWNCGALMRRDKDQIDYKPRVGLLYSNGEVEPHYLDISKDKHLTADEMKDAKEYEEIDMEIFASELRKLGASALDFEKAMEKFCCHNKIRKTVQDIIQKAMEK